MNEIKRDWNFLESPMNHHRTDNGNCFRFVVHAEKATEILDGNSESQ